MERRACTQDDRKGSSLLYTAWGVALLHCTFCIFRQQSLKAHPYYPASILAPPDRPASCLTSRLGMMRMRADQSAVGAVNRPLQHILSVSSVHHAIMAVA